MRIGIDCQYLLTNVSAGPEKYTINLVSSLVKIDSENTYVLYFKSSPSEGFIESLIGKASNVEAKFLPSSLSWTQLSLMKELRKDPPDVFFTPFHTLPVLGTWGPFRVYKIKWVSMIHGIEHTYEHKSKLKQIWQTFPLWYTVKFSDEVIVPSEHTKDKILKKKWKKSSENIHVISEGVSPRFKKYSHEKVAPVLEKYNLSNVPYVIFISTIQPRKNLPNLVAGFAEALKSGKVDSKTKLLVVGKKGWDYEESLTAPQKEGIKNNVIFAGRVSDEDLPKLLSGASLFASVSLEEGFGLPLLEAMVSKVPLVVSKIPSYENIAGNCALFVDPVNFKSIAEGLIKGLTDYPDEYVSKAFSVAERFSWNKTAEKTLKVLKN
jgi:glycosyltransferase involved in cell wall biosynthesis